MRPMLRRRADGLALILCILYILLASAWIGEMGVQTDEALFSGGIYPPLGPGIELLGKHRPLMVMTYVGTLKSYAWKPIMRNIGASAVSIRLPAVLLGAITLWMFYRMMKWPVGVRAALVSTALLATDATFVLTNRWDWGPVAIQHACLVGGVLSILRFTDSRRLPWLALGFFIFGLGLWDKALFIWNLVALGLATIAVFPRRTLALLTPKTLAVAAGGLVLGAAPLIYFNFTNSFVTFRQNAGWSWNEPVRAKAQALMVTFEGGGMQGSVVRDDGQGAASRNPDDVAKRLIVSIAEWTGHPRSGLYALLASLALVLSLFAWRTPAFNAFLFAIVFCAAAFLQMAFTPGAGGSPHHLVLIWPFPHLAIGAVLAESSRRLGRFGVPILTTIVLAACLSSIAVIGTYYSYMLRYGGVKEWTDAIYPAVESLPALRPSHVCFLDWGFYDNVRLLTRGRINVCAAVDAAADPAGAKSQMAISDIVYMTHTSPNRLEPQRTESFVALATAEGYRKTEERVFYDFNGRPMIEVFKLFRP